MKLTVILLFLSFSCYAQDFYSQINHIRMSNNLPPLERSAKLEKQSKRWLKHLSNYPGIFHTDKNVNEVLCEVSGNPINAWMASKTHHKMLLSAEYKKIGFARRGNRYCARLK